MSRLPPVMLLDARYLPFFVAFAAAACAPYESDVPAPQQSPNYSVDHAPAPTGPEARGEAPASANDAQLTALWWVNAYRAQAGLGPVDQLATLNTAAAEHANYVLLHPELYDTQGVSVHEQLPGQLGFSGGRFWERMASAGYDGRPFREVIAYQSTPDAAVAHWMETVYHRLPIIHPSARHIGYAQARIGSSRINVLDIGSGDIVDPESPWGVAWPPPGAVDVPLSWDGLESPKPPAPPTGYPSGPVITLTFGLEASFECLEHTISDVSDDDRALPHVLLTPESDPHLEGESSVALYTWDPLQAGRTYRVAIRGILDGAPYERTWSFTTRASATCDAIGQDCGAGKGCYVTQEGAVCAWAGDLAEGLACTYQNDCGPGLTCVGGACRRYCDTASDDCKSSCSEGYSKLNVSSEIGACKL